VDYGAHTKGLRRPNVTVLRHPAVALTALRQTCELGNRGQAHLCNSSDRSGAECSVKTLPLKKPWQTCESPISRGLRGLRSLHSCISICRYVMKECLRRRVASCDSAPSIWPCETGNVYMPVFLSIDCYIIGGTHSWYCGDWSRTEDQRTQKDAFDESCKRLYLRFCHP
jgi:hypothetical protein